MTNSSALSTEFLSDFQFSSTDGFLDNHVEFYGRKLFLNVGPGVEISGHWRSPVGKFLELQCSVKGSGPWLGLHIALNEGSILSFDHLVLLMRIDGAHPGMMRASLRSGSLDGTFQDVFFDKHLIADSRPCTHLDSLYLDSYPDLLEACDWRELVLFLPVESFQLNIHQIKLFWS